VGDELPEDVVDPVDHRGGGAEVGGQPHGRVPEHPAGAQEQVDVRAAEPVDGLLRVADEEQPSGIDGDFLPGLRGRVGVAGGDAHGQLDLDGVGVLELVEEQALVAVVQAAAHLGAVGTT
jgi:hypothetical protein